MATKTKTRKTTTRRAPARRAVTQAQLVDAVSETTGYSKSDVRHVLQSLDDVVIELLANAEKVKIGQLVQLEVKIRPPRKARMGRNPATGEAVKIAAKGAAPVVRARILKRAKDATPSLQKARKVMG
jgi:nucleoid DNA-binding protein